MFARKNQTRKKTLFYRIICSADIFASMMPRNRAQSVAMLRLSLRAIGFDDGFGPLTHKRAAESLFFSLCCSKRNAVQVDSRPH
jgi:hypothetical protein